MITLREPARDGPVVVADADPASAGRAAAVLAGAGYHVQRAASWAQLEALLAGARVVLLDPALPGAGAAACAEVRRLAPGAALALVLDAGALEAPGAARDADDVVGRPLHTGELLARVGALSGLAARTAADGAEAELRTELARVAGHDLRNSLASVMTNAQFLLQQELADDARDAAGDVLGAAESMHRVVLNLVDVVRSRGGRLQPVLAEVDLAVVLREVCAAMERRAAEKHQRLELAVDPAYALVRADRNMLHRALENLLDNAFRYAPRDGVVRVELRRRERQLELQVHDAGPAIPAAHREHAFAAVSMPTGGAHVRTSHGLGLAFCRLCAEAHGGAVWAEGGEPTGNRFCLRLPALEPGF